MAIEIFQVELYGESISNPTRTYASSIKLPVSKYAVDDVLDECRQYLVDTDIHPLTILNSPSTPLLQNVRFDSVTLYELNYLAGLISKLNEGELAVFNAYLPRIVQEEDVTSFKDVVNLAYSARNCGVAYNISTYEELGQFLLDNNMVEGIKDLSENALKMIDFKKVAETYLESHDGVILKDIYVEFDGFKIDVVYDGENLPKNAQETYLFKFNVFDGFDESTISLPLSDEDKMKVDCGPSKMMWSQFQSGIPQITTVFMNKGSISKNQIEAINDIANAFVNLPDFMQGVYFKAALYFEDITSFDNLNRIKELLDNPYQYNLHYQNIFPADLARDYLKNKLPNDFPPEHLAVLDTAQLGAKLMKEMEGDYTPYGVITKARTTEFAETDDYEYQLMEVCGKKVIFTDDRIKPEDIPEGLYKYEFRSGAEYVYAILEEKVGVDFSGTILSKEPFCLGEDEYIDFEKLPADDYPDVIAENISLSDYLNDYFSEDEEIEGGMNIC